MISKSQTPVSSTDATLCSLQANFVSQIAFTWTWTVRYFPASFQPAIHESRRFPLLPPFRVRGPLSLAALTEDNRLGPFLHQSYSGVLPVRAPSVASLPRSISNQPVLPVRLRLELSTIALLTRCPPLTLFPGHAASS